MKRKTESGRTGGGAPFAALFAGVCLAGLPAVASTCIVSLPEGDRDPRSSMPSAAHVIDAGMGGRGVLADSALEARFATYGASLGTGVTTMPLGSALLEAGIFRPCETTP